MPAPLEPSRLIRTTPVVDRRPLALSAAMAFALGACAEPDATAPTRRAPAAAASVGVAAPAEIVVPQGDPIAVFNGVTINRGGYGSALASADRGATLYLLTDRGANVALTGGIGFGKPDYVPQIGKFTYSAGGLTLAARIRLQQADGTPLTGLPQPNAEANRTEVPLTLSGAPLPFDPFGLDSEGLALASDGSFWVSDEYGPDIVRFDATGRTLQRLRPSAGLPLVLSRRRVNRGMEGLTILRDGSAVVGIMQSPLDNPTAGSSSAGRTSRLTRIVYHNLGTGTTREFAYLLESASLLNSEIVAITPTRFLVLERDGNFGDGAGGGAVKKIYVIDLTGATDISDPQNSLNGIRVGAGNLTLEELTAGVADPAAVLLANGIVPVSKSLLVDILVEIPTYPHDKLEGVAIVDDRTIAISNDDDFGVTDNGAGQFIAKTLPSRGNAVDFNSVYFIRLPQVLR